MSRAGALVAFAAVALSIITFTPPVAQASPVSAAELPALVARATAGDPAALARLQAITSISGQPTTLGQTLRFGTPSEIHARLLALGAPVAAATVSAAAAQRVARSIVGTPRYGRATVTDPLLSLLNRIGGWLSRIARGAPGGPPVFWALAAVVVLLAAAVGARRMLRGLGAAELVARRTSSISTDDPAALELQAQDAEARAAFAEAIRLRFRAGLLRLGARSAIDYRPSLLTADVARRLQSPEFDRLADTFERVTYGHATAGDADAANAREGWREILAHTGSER